MVVLTTSGPFSVMDILTTGSHLADPTMDSTPEIWNTTIKSTMKLMISNFTGFSNDSLNGTFVASRVDKVGKNRAFMVMLMAVYVVGILGNLVAIVTLRRGVRRVRNRKHLLMLTSLAANDLVALMGMLSAMVVAQHVPGARDSQLYCGARVLLRTFGIGSVCIAVTMALERFLALTRPFFYQKQVTYYVIRTVLLVSWLSGALLACAPMLGVGLYHDALKGVCRRYREADKPLDVAYAIIYVVFGTLLCIVLVYCNLAVIRALYAITAPRGSGAAPLVRRVSRVSCRQRARTLPAAGDGASADYHNAATTEEVEFSRLMAMLSVLFMICWLPQMVTSMLYLALGSQYWTRLALLADLSDVLMLLNYVLDPVLYVLPRGRRPFTTIGRAVARCFKRSMYVEEIKVSHKTSNESMSLKTSCVPETVISDGQSAVSASSSAESRPLRALVGVAPPALDSRNNILKL